mmetsp:Transcript_41527/g.96636  ORF Transcript_41527/g.96636 Transcript_41527/m.96636 type:complete len:277 (+) Transcript_41527:3135-3965(+)
MESWQRAVCHGSGVYFLCFWTSQLALATHWLACRFLKPRFDRGSPSVSNLACLSSTLSRRLVPRTFHFMSVISVMSFSAVIRLQIISEPSFAGIMPDSMLLKMLATASLYSLKSRGAHHRFDSFLLPLTKDGWRSARSLRMPTNTKSMPFWLTPWDRSLRHHSAMKGYVSQRPFSPVLPESCSMFGSPVFSEMMSIKPPSTSSSQLPRCTPRTTVPGSLTPSSWDVLDFSLYTLTVALVASVLQDVTVSGSLPQNLIVLMVFRAFQKSCSGDVDSP